MIKKENTCCFIGHRKINGTEELKRYIKEQKITTGSVFITKKENPLTGFPYITV